ncbi:MAG TPA: SulP family inorganic anion transporter [Streptosporangiaceae bacterium]|nr:SulP family inorganic anion transporter [Streptosporangiaceae bacterium]
MSVARWARSRDWPVLEGVRPVRRTQLATDALAGLTLAALGIPEVLGYARIAGMPVVTGLYTLLLPMALFAVLGASRHLVVAADSATAAILASALIRLAAPQSAGYVQLAGLAGLLTGGLLLLARLARLGFLANFLSRTVLLGFLTGVGIQVAIGQLPDMLGTTATSPYTLIKLGQAVAALPRAKPADVALSAAVIGVMLAARGITRRIPGALIAVIGAIIVSWAADLASHGVSVLGHVPRGLPQLGLPALGLHDTAALLGASASIFIVILAQSAATARAYAVKHAEPFGTETDLIGLGAANIAAAFSGTFIVNGSPTKTQIVDDAGGRSQLAQLTTSAVTLVVLLSATGPLAYLPSAALAAVVFLIGAELVDRNGMRHILSVRRHEFVVALVTAVAVVALSIQYGIAVAVIASIIDHLRHSYRPRSSVLVKSAAGHWRPAPVLPGARTEEGLVVYRFGTSLYYANAARFVEDVLDLAGQGSPLRWLVLDGAAIGDVDYTASSALAGAIAQLHQRHVRVVVTSMAGPVREQLAHYGITGTAGPDVYYDTPGEALEAFHASAGDGPGGDQRDGPGAGPPQAPAPG